MNLREEILREHSKAQSMKIAGYVGSDAKRFEELMGLFLHDEYRVVQRAAWIVSHVAEKTPGMIQVHLPAMVGKMLESDQASAVRRNVLRILQFVEIPEDLHGVIMDSCFRFASDPNETIAVRAFSLKILGDLAALYTEIEQELRSVIEAGMEQDPTPAFRSSARYALKKFEKRSQKTS